MNSLQRPFVRAALLGLALAGLAAQGFAFFDRSTLPHYLQLIFAGVVCAAGLLVLRAGGIDLLDRMLFAFSRLHPPARWTLAAILLCALILVARIVLDAFPNSGDEYAYILQAQTYSEGRLWVDAPPLVDAFRQPRLLAKGGIWISQYLPGWATVLTPAAWLGVPLWLVNPALGVALLAACFYVSRHQAGREASWAALIAIATSAFFVLNAASYFSHVVAALFALLFALFGVRYLEIKKAHTAVIAGAFVGALGLTRVFDAAIITVPFAAALALTPGRRAGLIWLALGGAPFLAALFAFNAAVTGNPLMMIPAWYGIGKPVGVPDAESIRVTISHLVNLAIWTSPLMLIGFASAFVSLARRRRLNFIDWIAPATLVAYALYTGTGGNQYGPRYYFEAFPFAILTIAKALDGALFVRNGAPRPALAAAAVLMHFAFQIGQLAPRLYLEHQIVVEREDLYRKVAAAKLSNAVVLIASGTGTIRPMLQIDLARNGLHIGNAPVVYAQDLRERNDRIRILFPGRQFYRYADGKLEPLS